MPPGATELARLRTCMAASAATLGECETALRTLLAGTQAARARGAINDAIWDCERRAGRRPHHFSQSGQDAFLDERVFGGRRGGVFVEVGGYDGVTGSNCLFLELMRGWTGLVIEPSPTFHPLAASARRVPCLAVAVGGREGEAEFLDVREGFRQMGGLVETYDPGLRTRVEADPRHRGEIVRVPVRPLAAILDEHGLVEVDYVSLDVEGAELATLEAFPFERFRVTAWTVENNDGSATVPQLMAAKGYRRVEALGVDDVYVLPGRRLARGGGMG